MTLRTLDIFARRPLAVLTLLCVAGSVASSLRNQPHSLAYFNEAAGGPECGWKHMLGSSVDWGQELHLIDDWLVSHGIPRAEISLVTAYPAHSQAVTGLPHKESQRTRWEIISIEALCKLCRMPPNSFSTASTAFRLGHTLCVYRVPLREASEHSARRL